MLPPVPTDERLSFAVDQFTGSGHVELLHQRTQLIHRLRDIADAAASLDNLAVRSRHRSYGLDIGM